MVGNVKWKIWLIIVLSTWKITDLPGQTTPLKTDSVIVYELGSRAFALRSHKPDSALLLANEALRLAEMIPDTQAQVNLRRIIGVVHYGQRRMDEAYHNFTSAYQLARQIHFREGRLLINLGNIDFYRKDFEKALDKYQQALSLSEQKDTVVWMDALNNTGSVYSRLRKFQEAVDAFLESLLLQRATNHLKAQLPTLVNLGEAYRKLNQTEKEVAIFQDGLELAKSLQDAIWIARFYEHIGQAYANRAFYPQSLAAWQSALSIYTDQGDSLAIAKIWHRIGVIQLDIENYSSATDFHKKSLAMYREQSNIPGQASSLNSIGRSLLLQKQYEKAREQFQQSRILYQQLNLPGIRYPFYNLGDSYEQSDQLDSAIFYLNTAYQISDSLKDYYLKSLTLTSLGKIAKKRGDLTAAIDRFKEAISMAKIESMRQEELVATWELYQTLKQQDRLREALAYLERHHTLRDSIFNEESTRKITQLEAQYTFEQEKKAIADQNAAEKRKLDEEIRQQRTWQTILGIALMLSILALVLLNYFLRFRKAAELEQERLNNQINLQQLTYEQKERERLQEIDSFKSRFFANISHELRTPLTLILGPINRLLKKGGLDQPGQTQLELVQENARFLLNRTNEILDLTKFDAHQMQLQETPTVFYDFTKRLAANFESFAQQKFQQLIFTYHLDKDLNLLLDQTKFAHIFNNYLSNAIKYTPESGCIQIILSERKNTKHGRLVLEVKDNGIGIREKDLPHVFERFYQADQSENKAGGSGIGLALSKEVAQLMQGAVWLDSKSGEGSSFYFEFPYREVMGVVPEEEEIQMINAQIVDLQPLIPKAESVPNRSKLLVVEDNKQLRDYLQLILSDHYEVLTAKNGEDALQKLASWDSQLIISDVMMPKMDGFELLTHLKDTDQYRHLPVIMLTARSEMEDRLKALRIGVDDYLLKPFVEDELLSRVRNLLGNYQNRQVQHTGKIRAKTNISAADLQWLEEVEAVLKQEVHNPGFTFDQLETRLFISRSQLQRRIKKITGLTPNKYFREIKLQVARELLESGEVRTVNEVAHAIGFDTAKYFSKIYEDRFGQRPVEWL